MNFWQLLLLVAVTGAIIGIAIAAYVSMVRSNYHKLTHIDDEPPAPAPTPDSDPLARPARPRLQMRERQAELHGAMRQRTGHVDTIMVKLPPKDGEGQDNTGR